MTANTETPSGGTAANAVRGWSEPGFGSVVHAFASTIPDDGQTGGALSVWIEGRPVIEVHGGIADHRTGEPFTERTLQPIFSCSKGVASLLVARLVERGLIESFETPVAAIWPEFAANGKDSLTIGDALAHRGGVSAPRVDLTQEQVLDGATLADALAAQEPLWEPGTNHHYHALSHGVFTEQLVARSAGVPISQFLQTELAVPLQAEVFFGLGDEQSPRLSHWIDAEGEVSQFADQEPIADPEAAYWHDRAMTLGGGIGIPDLNRPEVFHHVLAGVGGVATASGLARIWSSTVTPTLGYRSISDEMIATLSSPRSSGPGRFPVSPPPYQSWGAGVMIPSDWERYLTPRSFGHDGAGGQVAFADPETRIAVAYLTNRMGDWARGQRIVSALSHVVGI
ncbi:serine hydrolase domain-containing protein [Leifsonia sp. SIMBA_070]|uniref:serine hydrolase domain-containing protein n=1 Tax=Leifsonia sp. SIMBA_070 TaxID=3085810 RepID=UPI00397C764C